MTVVAACPKCRTSYRVDATRLGRQVACTKCKTQFVLTASQADTGTGGARAESQSAVSGSPSVPPAPNGQTGAPRKDAVVRTIIEQPAEHDTSVEQVGGENKPAASAASGAPSKSAPAKSNAEPESNAPSKSKTASSGSSANTGSGGQPPSGASQPAPAGASGGGDTKSRFEILGQLGEGAFGMVYKARDTKLERLVALKVPKLGVLGSKRDVERFLREARSAGNLRHQHIVPIYDAGELGKSYFIASGFIEGNTLESLLPERPNPDLAATAALIQKLALALHYAHGKGIVHRDIKPGNVMIDVDGEPMIVDFGLARREEGDLLQTRMHAVMGTPAYMSPEQHTGVNEHVGPASDQWALGIMLYEMLVGRRPFQGNSAAQLGYAVLKTEAERPSKLNPRISRDLETICLKCLEKDPAKRYASCRALADDLGHWLRDEPILARPIRAPERFVRWCRRKPAVAGLVATVATLLTLVALVSMWAYGKTSLALRTADAERQRAETALGQVEAEKSRAQTALVQVEAERNRAEAEKARAEAERRRSDEQKQVAQAAEKNALEAKRHAEESEKNALEAQRRIELSMYQANIQLARRDWLAAMVDEADRRLDACPVESRKWEWNYLKRLCHLRGAVVVKRPISERIWDPRASLRLSPDWQCFATIGPGPRSGADRVVKICDASGGRLLTTLQGQEYLERIGFSPDGGKIAGLSRSDLTVWNPRTGEKIVSVPAKGVQTRWAFRPDGRQIATTEPGPLPRESTVRIHDATSGKELRALKIKIKGGPRENQVRTFIAYSPDGKLIATGGQDVINIWNATSGDEIRQMTGHQSDIWDLSFSPDGTRIASASMDRSARVWDVTTGQQLLTLRGHNDIVTGVRFSPSGKEIATASVDGTLRTWDAATGSERLTFRGHAQPIYSVDFDPKGEHIATTSDDGTIRIWNSAEEQQYRTSPGFGEPLVNHHVPFGIDWKRVRNGPDALDSCLAPHVAQNGTYVLFASPDTKRAVGLTADRTGIALWDTENGQELLVLKKGWQLQRGVLRPLGCFSPDGRKIALQPPTRGWEERCDLEILDAATGALVCTLPNPGATSSLAFSPDGKRVAGDASQQLRIWTVEHGRLDAEIEFKREPSEEPLAGTLGFSPNGRWIAWRGMGGTDRAVRTLDLERGNKITELHGHRYGASCLTFSPDSTRLVTAGYDMIKIWDLAAGQELLSLKPREDTSASSPVAVSFSPDGKRLGCEYIDGRVTIWDSSLPEDAPRVADPD